MLSLCQSMTLPYFGTCSELTPRKPSLVQSPCSATTLECCLWLPGHVINPIEPHAPSMSNNRHNHLSGLCGRLC